MTVGTGMILAGVLLLAGMIIYLVVNHLMKLRLNVVDDDEELESDQSEEFVQAEAPTEQPQAQQLTVDPLSGYPLMDQGVDLYVDLPEDQNDITLRVNGSTLGTVQTKGLRHYAADLLGLSGSMTECLVVEWGAPIPMTGNEVYRMMFGEAGFNERFDLIEQLNGSTEPEPEEADLNQTMVAGSDMPMPTLDDIVPQDFADPVGDEQLEEVFQPVSASYEEPQAEGQTDEEPPPEESTYEEGLEELLQQVNVSAEESQALDAALAAGQEPAEEESSLNIERMRTLAAALGEVPMLVVDPDDEPATGQTAPDATSEQVVVEPVVEPEPEPDAAYGGDKSYGLPPGSETWAGTTPVPQPFGEAPTDFDPNDLTTLTPKD